jgi:hypothetical protein
LVQRFGERGCQPLQPIQIKAYVNHPRLIVDLVKDELLTGLSGYRHRDIYRKSGVSEHMRAVVLTDMSLFPVFDMELEEQLAPICLHHPTADGVQGVGIGVEGDGHDPLSSQGLDERSSEFDRI